MTAVDRLLLRTVNNSKTRVHILLCEEQSFCCIRNNEQHRGLGQQMLKTKTLKKMITGELST